MTALHDDTSPTLEALAVRALAGDAAALSALCRALQGPIYRLSLRMLGDLQDAEDASQEILVQVITHLSQFEGRSRLFTWAYTIASRHLLRFRASRREQRNYQVTGVAHSIDAGLSVTEPSAEPEGDALLLERELRWTCTQAMLLCLTRDERLAILLVHVLGADDVLGAEICQITAEAFRKRLSRARAQLKPLMEERCGLVDDKNACRCRRQASAMQRHRGLSVEWAAQPQDVQTRIQRANTQLTELTRLTDVNGEVFGLEPPPAPPERMWTALQQRFPDLLT